MLIICYRFVHVLTGTLNRLLHVQKFAGVLEAEKAFFSVNFIPRLIITKHEN